MESGKRSDDFTQFKNWLAERQKHFNDIAATPAEIADLAIEAGFPLYIVRLWQSGESFRRVGEAS